jgi:epoxyqueuosine reductase QueG
MGLLMTPRQGPRVRLGVVTTDLPLIPDIRSPSQAILEYCRACRKCAECCPSQSIPMGDRVENGGALRWQIDADSCFRYWCTVGTDCGRCMTVCPFSNPDTLFHKVIRYGVGHSRIFRRAAVLMDNLFYRKKPIHTQVPGWIEKFL